MQLKMTNHQVHVHISPATPPHNDEPPRLHICSFFTGVLLSP